MQQKTRKLREKTREGITIFDCTVKSQEKCSEGKFIDEYIKILNHQRKAFRRKPVWHKVRYVRCPTGGITSLQDWLKYVYTWTIHISAHGDKQSGETCLIAGNSPFRLNDLRGIWSDRTQDEKPQLIVLSACNAGHKDLIKAFANEGCRYCIAPVREPDWEKAALFSALFYTYLFFGPRQKYDPMLPTTAFEKAKKRLRELTGDWKMFEYVNEIPPLARGYVT